MLLVLLFNYIEIYNLIFKKYLSHIYVFEALLYLHRIKTFKEKVNLVMKYFDLIHMGCTATMHFILYLQRFLSNNEIS